MTKEDVERLVSARMREALSGKVYRHQSGDEISAMLKDLRPDDIQVDENGILKGMTVVVHEEPDDVKLIREVMEEPLETLRATVTISLPMSLDRIYMDFETSPLLPSLGVESPPTGATTLEADPDPALRVDEHVLRDELVTALAVGDDAQGADPAAVDGEGEAPVHE